jgi:hypothetical protein
MDPLTKQCSLEQFPFRMIYFDLFLKTKSHDIKTISTRHYIGVDFA